MTEERPGDSAGWDDEAHARRRLLGGGVWSLTNLLVTAALGLPLTIILVRTLSRRDYGDYAIGVAIASLLSVLAALGLADAVARRIVDRPGGSDSDVRRTVGAGLRVAALTAVGAAVAVVAVTVVLRQSPSHGRAGFVVAALAPIAVLAPFQAVCIGTLRATYRPRLLFTATVTSSALVLTGTVVALAAGARDAPVVAAVRSGAMVVGLGILVVSARRWLRLPATADAGEVAPIVRVGAVVVTVTLAAAAISALDVVVLGAVKGSATAGVYAPVSRLIDAVAAIFAALGTYALVALTRAATSSSAALGDRYHWCSRWTLVALAPVLGVLLVRPGPVLSLLFGPSIGQLTTPTRIMAAALSVHIVLGYNGLALIAAGETRLVFWQGVVALAVSVLACVTLVPLFGVVGAASATASAMMASNVFSSVSLYSRQHVAPLDRRTAMVLAGFVAGLAAAVVVAAVTDARWGAVVAAALLTGGGAAVGFLLGGMADSRALARASRGRGQRDGTLVRGSGR